MANRLSKKLTSGVLAAILLVSASNAMAQSLGGPFVDVWVYAGVQSSSGTVELDLDAADFCMEAVGELRAMGFRLKNMTPLEPRLTALYFESRDDAVALFCALIVERKS